MADFSINTHHAYLNTNIVIRNNAETSIVVKDLTTSDEWVINDEKIICLSAGTHVLTSRNTKTTIIVEDAIKFGGGRINKAFVFDDNPWAFVTLKDRFYAVNMETGEEKVEHVFAPDEIHSLGRYYGKTCEYFLFDTKGDYSVYNVETGEIILTFSNHIYSNSHLVIYRSDDNVVVYDYRLGKTITEFDGQYSFGRKFYYINKGILSGLNLSTSFIFCLHREVGLISTDHILHDNYLIRLKTDHTDSKIYELIELGSGELGITSTLLTLPYYLGSCEGHPFNKLSEARKSFTEYKNESYSINRKYPNIKHHFFKIDISSLAFEWEKKERIHIVNIVGEVKSYPIEINIPFALQGKEGKSIDFKNCVIEKVKSDSPVNESVESNDMFQLPKEEKLLGKSSSGNLCVSLSGHQIIYRNIKEDIQKNILSKLYDSSQYINAYFTSDGKKAVFENEKNEFKIIGFEDLSFDVFDVEGMSVPRQVGFNGYKPEIEIMDLRKPVWRDPISLVKVKPEDLSNHIFMSPDGKYSAKNSKKQVIINRITNKEITTEEFLSLREEYNFLYSDTEDVKKEKIAKRKKLYEEVGKDVLFKRLIDYWKNKKQKTDIVDEKKKKQFDDVITKEIEYYLNKEDIFSPLFLDILGFVIFQDNISNEEKRILIGCDVRYLNYVSFSYDSRYLAFAAKMFESPFRDSADGVFVLYDLQEGKEIVRQDDGQGLYAVWMTMFSKKGDVSYYDSKADAYLITKSSDYTDIQKIKGKSLLCFSPSGKYIAFSDQNYISHANHPDANWGHQPSGNIFIHPVNDVTTCIEHFNDLGEGITGVVSRAGSVASAAFSSDEKRLMAVGEDGVVIVRNLHLPHESEELSIDSSFEQEDYIDDYGTHYGEFAGSYAQDVMGYSDDVINDAFEGDPDAYWNID